MSNWAGISWLIARISTKQFAGRKRSPPQNTARSRSGLCGPRAHEVGERMTAAEQVERIFRAEHGRVLAALISQFEDFDLAEDALQDALVNALERWQSDGIPENPGAWLTTAARRRAIDRIRHTASLEQRLPDLGPQLAYDEYKMDETQIPDDRLKLMFTCCH